MRNVKFILVILPVILVAVAFVCVIVAGLWAFKELLLLVVFLIWFAFGIRALDKKMGGK